MENIITVRPKKTDALLTNPGTGFHYAVPLMEDNVGADGLKDTRQNPVAKFKFTPDSRVWNYPESGVIGGYVFWRDAEPAKGVYDWSSLDESLERAKNIGCKMIVRCAPYGFEGNPGPQDVPGWFREEVGPERPDFPFWQVDPHNTNYVEYFTNLIRVFGEKYDGHPYIHSVDVALVGSWGEGGGTEFLEDWALHKLVDIYFESFKVTPMQCLLHCPHSVEYIKSKKRPVGFRVDCLGDMGGFHNEWSHMHDFYPENIGNFDMSEAWKTAPIIFEACWHTSDWYHNGWDIDYIIDESLKWHASTYNAKMTTLPEAWRPNIERWLRKMGYRFELRSASFSSTLTPGGVFEYETFWVNAGVAPAYYNYPLAFRLVGDGRSFEMITGCDSRKWLPDLDILESGALKVPQDVSPGNYSLEVALLCDLPTIPNIYLGIEGRNEDGWYPLSVITVTK